MEILKETKFKEVGLKKSRGQEPFKEQNLKITYPLDKGNQTIFKNNLTQSYQQ